MITLSIPKMQILLIEDSPLLRRLLAETLDEIEGVQVCGFAETEREALEAGTTWWEKELFSGKPNWNEFAQINLPQLTAEEQSFLDNEVSEFCSLLDEWDIQHNRKDLSPEAWQYLKDKGFFGLIIPKEFGGHDFSPHLQLKTGS